MGRINSSEDINAPEDLQGMAPQQDQPIASSLRTPKPGQVGRIRGPTHLERVAAAAPTQASRPIGLTPGTPGLHLPIDNPWTTGLFDCCDDPTNAIMTILFPCVTFGQLVEILQSGNMSCAMGTFLYLTTMPLVIVPSVMGANYRKMLRAKFGLVEAPYPDLLSHCFCLCCSLCQEFRELKNRGFDPARGYSGVMAQHRMLENNQMNISPPMQGMFK